MSLRSAPARLGGRVREGGERAIGQATAPGGGGATWPNEPAGFTVWQNTPWNATNPDPSRWEWAFGEGGNGTIVSDAAAPVSPSNVLQIKFPTGFTGSGQEPVKLFWNDSSPLIHLPKQLFLAFAFKLSNPWDGHLSGVNKIMFQWMGSSTNWFYIAFTGTGVDQDQPPFHLRVNTDETGLTQHHTWLDQNVNNVALKQGVLGDGNWQKLEFLFQYSTTTSSSDGVIKWWVDNTLAGNYSDINMGFSGFTQFEITPVWGGVASQTKSEDDFYWIDHLYMSVHA